MCVCVSNDTFVIFTRFYLSYTKDEKLNGYLYIIIYTSYIL